MAKVDTRTLSFNELQVLRQRGVGLVLGGMTQAAAARETGVTAATMCSWMKRHNRRGEEGLVDRKRGKKRILLTKRQSERLRALIIGRHPGQLRLDFALWTVDAVIALTADRFGVSMSKRTTHRLLHEWGFTPKRSTRRAWQQDSQAVEQWIAREYPALASRAKREKALIFWGDEAGVRNDERTIPGWAPKGERAIALVNGARYSCNVISAIDNEGRLCFQVFKGGFRASSFIVFMKQLLRHSRNRKVHLIVDRHPAHIAKVVQAWLAERREKIEVHFIPAYSPELNPDEYLNNDLKAQTVRRRSPDNHDAMVSMVRSHLRRRQRQPQVVANFFQAPLVRYAS